jgi:hypothetical protein
MRAAAIIIRKLSNALGRVQFRGWGADSAPARYSVPVGTLSRVLFFSAKNYSKID